MTHPPNPELDVFSDARRLPAQERAAFLDQACAGDPALRQRVEELLRVHEQAGGFLEAPPAGLDFKRTVPGDALTEKPGDRIGRYQLLQQIGEGGCGVVYMAEQEKPVRRRVALKVIKLGMDTKSVIARFEAERQALALMDHPNIARVLDAGATETGRPYFVMELVRGSKITDHCDRNNLSTRERLDLFIQVCKAVQHAHQKGIIHRDLKPSNILITMNDGVPVPKVIDFGIAKATQGKLTDLTVFTAFEQFLGTPAYMSPEQAEMSAQDIDTRSDIYSLGVLLYELLTGQTPFDAKRLLQAGLDEIRRTIREQEPARPSTRLSTMLDAHLTEIAKLRKAEPLKLIHLVRGDLDWIVMKALEKNRTRRYETANGFAADIQRHLDSEPVLARPPSRLYRFQKLARRYKAAFAAAMIVAVILVAATGISAWQAVRARRAEAQAKDRLADSEAISTFLTEVFQSPSPGREGRTITVAETLDKAARKLDQSLTNQPARRSQLQETLANTYIALGLPRDAIPLAEAAYHFTLAAYGPENPDTIRAMFTLGVCYCRAARYDEAIKIQEEALALSRKVNGPEHPDTLRAMLSLADTYYDQGREDDARNLEEKILPLSRKVNGAENSVTIRAMLQLATCYRGASRTDEAIKLLEEALPLSRKVNGPEHPNTLVAMEFLGFCYSDTGRHEEAIKIVEGVLALSRKVNGPEHPDTIDMMNSLAASYADAGRYAEATTLLEETVPLSRKVNGLKNRGTLAAMYNLSNDYGATGQWSKALAGFSNLVEAVPNVDWWNRSYEILLVQTADLEGWRRQCAVSLARYASTDNPVTAWRIAEDSLILPAGGTNLTGAVKLADMAVTKGKDVPDFRWFEFVKGLAEYRQGHFQSAVEWMQKILANTGVVSSPDFDAIDDTLDAEAYLLLAMAQRRLGQDADAHAAFAKGAETIETKLPKPESDDLGFHWRRWIIDQALLKEAQTTLGEPKTASLK